MNELKNEYFEWMYQLVCSRRKSSFRNLLHFLHNTDFRYSIEMDGNRAEDGTDLRYRFGYEHSLDGPVIAVYLDNRPCSVLEMMIALAIRCEEHIMDNPDIGNRTEKWFWSMLRSLGLQQMSNENFNEIYVSETIDRFLDREYRPDGDGGLFTLKSSQRDLRNVEIWYQAMWYLNEVWRELA